jgi:hypothetical protein
MKKLTNLQDILAVLMLVLTLFIGGELIAGDLPKINDPKSVISPDKNKEAVNKKATEITFQIEKYIKSSAVLFSGSYLPENDKKILLNSFKTVMFDFIRQVNEKGSVSELSALSEEMEFFNHSTYLLANREKIHFINELTNASNTKEMYDYILKEHELVKDL